LLGYLARDKCDIRTIKEGTIGRDEDHPYTRRIEETNTEVIEWVKKKLIPKKETIIVFDEAHFPGDYQTLIDMTVKNGYNVLKMSATFPKMDFSIDSTYPRTLKLVDGFKNEPLAYREDVKDENGKVIHKKGDPIKDEKGNLIDS